MTMRGGCRRARRLDGANRRSAAGGRAEEIQRGRRKSSSKPRVKPMQSAERRRCNQRENTSDTARVWELAKGGVRRGESRYGCPPPARMTVCTYRIVYHCKTHSRDPANQITLFCPITLHTSRSVRHVRPSSTTVFQLTLSPFASAKFSNFICIPAKVWYNIFLLTEFVIFPEILCSSLKPFFAVR